MTDIIETMRGLRSKQSRPRQPKGTPIEDVLFAHSEPDLNTGCRLWARNTNPRGYGQVTVSGRTVGAHRLTWMVANGPIQKGLFVCHRCDTPACVNIEHLFLGTPAENTADRDRKGRGRRADKHPNAKLNNADIPDILARINAGETNIAIAATYGVSDVVISNVRIGRTWSSVTGRAINDR